MMIINFTGGEKMAVANEVNHDYEIDANVYPGQDDWPTWNQLLRKYMDVEKVKQVIFVQYEKDTNARVQLYVKTDDEPYAWTRILQCPAFLGYNGLGKEVEGAKKTPIGDYGIFTAGGIKKNPGTKADYIQFDDHIFMADGPYYNKIVDDRKIPMSKLKDYEPDPFNNASPAFNYGLFIDYNKECIPGKGAGIFMHCTGAYDYTSGCVSVSEDDMKFILQNVDNNVRICIFPRDWN